MLKLRSCAKSTGIKLHYLADVKTWAGAFRETRRHDLLHEDTGVEVANSSAVGKQIAGHLSPYTGHRWRCRVHSREPGDAHSVRDVIENVAISADAKDKGHGVVEKISRQRV